MNTSFLDLFYLSKRQRRGCIVLIILIVLIPFIGETTTKLFRHHRVDFDAFQLQVEAFMAYQQDEQTSSNSSADPAGEVPQQNPRPSENNSLSQRRSPQRKTYDINRSDSIELTGIRGIGQILGSRIVRYREWLGGYYTISQLLEVYGIDSTRFEEIRPYVHANDPVIRQIDINQAEFAQLIRHPYLSREMTIALLRHRQSNGFFESPDQLIHLTVFDSLDLQHLLPYLTVNQIQPEAAH